MRRVITTLPVKAQDLEAALRVACDSGYLLWEGEVQLVLDKNVNRYRLELVTTEGDNGGRRMTGICPYARGFDPYDLTCGLAVAEDAGLPWWRRFVRALAGRHDCPHFNGDLPCERYDSSNKEDRT